MEKYPEHLSHIVVIFCSEDRLEEQRRVIWDALGAAFGMQAPGGTAPFSVKARQEILMEDVVTLASAGARKAVLVDHINCLGRMHMRGEMSHIEELKDIQETQALAEEQLRGAGIEVVARFVMDYDDEKGAWNIVDALTQQVLSREDVAKRLC